MPFLFWDASALAKRYVAEVGSDTVDTFFASLPASDMATTSWNYAETYSILLRRYNGGAIDSVSLTNAVALLRNEVQLSQDFRILSIVDDIVFGSLATMRKHNLNATDSAILALLLDLLPSPPPPDFVLLTADQRLMRAAQAEGIQSLNPTALSPTDVSGYLASL